MTQDTYIFYSYQWLVDGNLIKCYCVDQKSNPLIIHLNNYNPPLYISFDGISSNDSCDRFVTHINKILSTKSHYIVSYELVKDAKLSDNITNTTTYAILRFNNWNARNHCKNLFNMKSFYYYKTKISVLNTEIDDITLFLSDYNLEVCCWIQTSDLDDNYYCTKINKLESTYTPTYPLILSFDIECNSSNTNSMPKSYNLDDKIVMISAVSRRYLSTDTTDITFVLNLDPNIKYDGKIVVCNSEVELITNFLQYLVYIDPVVIVGYNIYGFDIPYIIAKLQLNLLYIPIDISRDSSGTYTRQISSHTKAYGYMDGTEIKCNGRVIIDLLTIFRRNNKFKVRTLDEVSRIVLEDNKANISAKDMFKIFSNPTKDGMTKVIDYCVKDSRLVLDLVDKLDMWVTWTEESASTLTNLDDLYVRGITHRASNMFYRECVKRNIIIKRHNTKRYSTAGGYVYDPIPGVYNNCTCVDFRSLYPSIIIEHNICVSTYIRTDKNGEHIFMREPVGIIPQMLVSLITKRSEILTLMKTIDDERIKSILNARQLSLKISANGIYGILSTPYDHILCFSPAADTVTALGRHYISDLNRRLRYDHGFECIYGDTDSCYITRSDITNKDEMIKATNDAINNINNALPKNINIAFERYIDLMFIITKKKYVLVIDGKMLHKGNVSIRRDNCEFTRRLYSDILDLALLKRYSIEDLLQEIVRRYRRLLNGLVDYNDLVMTCPVSKDYKNKSNQFNIMIDRLRRTNSNVSVNDRIQYLIVKTVNETCLQGYKMYPFEEVIEKGYYIDYLYYLSKKIHPVINSLLDSLGYTGLGYYISGLMGF